MYFTDTVSHSSDCMKSFHLVGNVWCLAIQALHCKGTEVNQLVWVEFPLKPFFCLK